MIPPSEQIASTSAKPLFRLSLLPYSKALNNVLGYFQLLSRPQKIILFSISSGLFFVGLASRYFQRRKRKSRKSALAHSKLSRRNRLLLIKSPSDEFQNAAGSVSPGFHRSIFHRGSVSGGSDKASVASILTGINQLEAGTLTPQQYGAMGMEALERGIGLWEEALASYTSESCQAIALPSQEVSEFTHLLQKVIEDAYSLQDQCEHLFLHEHSILFRSAENSPVASEATFPGRRTLNSYSSVESFVSAHGDIADLKNLEEFEENPPTLYLSALKHHEEYGIPYRDIRTDRVKCASDVEYICKLHCLRLASKHIFSQPMHKDWFAEAGRSIIEGIMLKAERDPKGALQGYDEFLLYISECDLQEVADELKGRGVPCVTFYDVVLDYILIDSFEDLENPPSSVYAVVQNRWLSNNFKESALSTAIWSVLKAKRRVLQYQDGFMSHFYDITEHLSPVFAWGFLGPDHRLREFCHFFKDQVEAMLQDLFSFSAVRYTNVEELSADILRLAHERFDTLMERMTFPLLNGGYILDESLNDNEVDSP